MDYTAGILGYKEKLKKGLDNIPFPAVNRLIDLLLQARDSGTQIFIMGNGGSGASASHFAGDLNKGLSLHQSVEKRYRCISLVDNFPTILSLANDVSYQDIFLEQLKNFLRPGDLVIALSGSGNSKNVLKAVKYANAMGNTTVGFTGFDGGKLRNLSDLSIHIPIFDMQIAEDMHMMLLHLVFSVLYHGGY